MIDQDIWTILQTYSFVQGILLAGYALVFLRRPYLAVLLLTISILLIAHLYYHFEWFLADPHFIFLEAPLWYLIGPFFYFFVLRLFGKTIRWYQLFHLVPFVSFLIFIVPFYFESGAEKVRILDSIFGEETYRVDVNRYIFTAHIFVYVIVSYLIFNRESKKLRQVSSRSTLVLDSVVSFTLKYYLLFSFFGFGSYLIVGGSYEWSRFYYELYYVGLSFLIHFIFYYNLVRSNNEATEVPDDSDDAGEAKKYSSSSLSTSELNEIINNVTAHISQFDVYRNPELRLRMVSDELKIPSHHISQAINQNLGKTFFDLVNEHRIEGLKKNIHDTRFKNYTLVGIASEHGFKSSSSFYRIFKKYTGKTPKQFFSVG